MYGFICGLPVLFWHMCFESHLGTRFVLLLGTVLYSRRGQMLSQATRNWKVLEEVKNVEMQRTEPVLQARAIDVDWGAAGGCLEEAWA